jgi:hypothetical protein
MANAHAWSKQIAAVGGRPLRLSENLLFRRARYFLTIVLAVGSAACTSVAVPSVNDPFAPPSGYVSQKRIILQGFSKVSTMEGPKNAAYFGYDRDGRGVQLSDGNWVAVDLMEFKLMQPDNTWCWDPIMVISDDDFDGYADRVLVDFNLDGRFELVFDIGTEKRVIDRMGFEEIKPWLIKEGGKEIK